MLKIAHSPRDIRVFELMEVYSGSKPNLDLSEFYESLKAFFSEPAARYMLWEAAGVYAAALRIEPYQDGMIIAGLETVPHLRGRGYATELLRSTISCLKEWGVAKIYSHVEPRNAASMKVHKRCGFTRIADHAVFLDGSVSTNCYTLCKSTAEPD